MIDKNEDKRNKELFDYYCQWCGYRFKQKVGRYVKQDDTSKGKSNVSSQVICPKCKMFVKTF